MVTKFMNRKTILETDHFPPAAIRWAVCDWPHFSVAGVIGTMTTETKTEIGLLQIGFVLLPLNAYGFTVASYLDHTPVR